MSPHRLTTIRRYKVPNDVLIIILQKMDPDTLYMACKALRRVYITCMEFLPLRYKYELALVGMRSGIISSRGPPYLARINLLQTYRTEWPMLKWTYEQKATLTPLHPSGNIGVTSGFINYIGQRGVEVMELPSCRTGTPPSQTRHMRIPTAPRPDGVTVDPTQNLMITAHALIAPNQLGLLLKIRDMWSFNKHKESASDQCNLNVPGLPGMVPPSINLTICGDKLLVRIDILDGPNPRIEHFLVNWKTLQGTWFTKQDLYFLDPNRILTVEMAHQVPYLTIYRIRDVTQPRPEVQFQLPEVWNGCNVNFVKNESPMGDGNHYNSSLFYSNPQLRVIMLTAHRSTDTRFLNWMLLPEVFFTRPLPPDLPGVFRVPWNDWCMHVVVRKSTRSRVLGTPVVVGTRVLYLDRDSTRTKARLNCLSFAPHAEKPTTALDAWDFIGPKTKLIPVECRREVPVASEQGNALQDLRASEDNILLLYENRNFQMPIKIFTFGASNPASSPHY